LKHEPLFAIGRFEDLVSGTLKHFSEHSAYLLFIVYYKNLRHNQISPLLLHWFTFGRKGRPTEDF
jgi:hypothetical protein